ncbi:MAG: hypothetical protein LRY66_12295 [Saccharospirillaceae bacterium]|nr:hypothetical protein [Saccharospirillaceae bacterium]MCD8532097.1 hypothetical protein [Saccharospirillaceae bacterium]
MSRYLIALSGLVIISATSLYACYGNNDSDKQADTANQTGTEKSVPPLPAVAVSERTEVTSDKILNDEASIPSQCYTNTESEHNPCYTCHQMYDRRTDKRLNRLDDGALQGSYMFSDVGVTNHWKNLFKDRQDWLNMVSDETILKYINENNYSNLAENLTNSGWKGFIPDLDNFHLGAGAFDEQGLALDGSYWVAFNYKPFPGTFWPTNGSTDDVTVRLAKEFREKEGVFDKDIYFINLTIAELSIKDIESTSIWPIDENRIGFDIDQNGILSTTETVVKSKNYIGDAQNIPVEYQQFPQGTELMHSVRYVGIAEDDSIFIPQRMKELRYMKKVNVLSAGKLASRYDNERKEKLIGLLPNFINRGDLGFDNGQGWFVQGFIENYDGALRPQSYEEGMFCMGCHAAIGTTIDSTFSYARKITGAEGWGYINLKGMKDAPSFSEPGGEILNYLKRAGGGSEFRENPEMVQRWYTANGEVDHEKVSNSDVYTLLAPSRERALNLNKAYTEIVRHQSFIHGRDATWIPAKNVYTEVDESIPPLNSEKRHYGWDIRLDWN